MLWCHRTPNNLIQMEQLIVGARNPQRSVQDVMMNSLLQVMNRMGRINARGITRRMSMSHPLADERLTNIRRKGKTEIKLLFYAICMLKGPVLG